jgi:hypothetical protein
MTGLSDETEGVCGDDHVGEAARIWLVNGLKQLAHKMASPDRLTVLRPVDKLRAVLTRPLAIHAVGIGVLMGNLEGLSSPLR